jgi:hypothetical protein
MQIIKFLAISMLSFVAGCGASTGGTGGGKLTSDQFLKIQNGMNHQDVQLILGGGPTSESGTHPNPRTMKWSKDGKTITVIIDQFGNVIGKTHSGL